MNKRILSIFMAVFMVVGLLPSTAFAAEGDPCKYAQSEGCTGTYTVAGYCNVCSRNEDGYHCACIPSADGTGYRCEKCQRYFDTCPHLSYDPLTYKCVTCGACGHSFLENCPNTTTCTSNDSLTHTVTVRCSGCGLELSQKPENHTVLSEATCLKRAVCEQCGEFDASTFYHETPTPTYTESTTNSAMHEIRYTCCGTVTTEEHKDEDGNSACDVCGSAYFHEHSFVYTYEKHPSFNNKHFIIKSCTGCNTTFEQTTETCVFTINCQGSVCPKCGNMDTTTFPDSHASSEITYIDNGDGTHSGVRACCNAAYVTNIAHDYSDPVCTWAEDYSQLTVTVSCICDATLSGSSTEMDVATSDDGFITTCTATVTLDGKEYTDSYSVTNTVSSATVNWGELSFTYTDGTGWNAPESAYVTVENTGNAVLSVTYTYETERTDITGSFTDGTLAVTQAAIDSGTYKTIWLRLTGCPSERLSNTPIGTVKLTIE